MPELGYVGLGVMGSAISRRLLDAGHTLTVWNRTREKAEPLLEAGARWAASPREVAERSEIVFTMVTNTEAVQAVRDVVRRALLTVVLIPRSPESAVVEHRAIRAAIADRDADRARQEMRAHLVRVERDVEQGVGSG